MYTTCPDCGTVFRISPAELRVASGYARCGHCSTIFNAVLSLSDTLPPAPDPEDADGAATAAADGGPAVGYGPAADSEPEPEAEPEPEPEPKRGQNRTRPLSCA